MDLFNLITLCIGVPVGAGAVLNRVSDESIEKMEKNLLTRWTIAKYFKFNRTINKAISKSTEKGSIKNTFKFSFGMMYLFLYFFFINIIIYLIKWIIYAITGTLEPNYFEGFSLLLGAGLAAFYRWFTHLRADAAKAKEDLLNKKLGKSVKHFASQTTKIIIIGTTYFFWVLGEVIFLQLSPSFQDWVDPYITIMFWIGLIYLLIISLHGIFGKSKKELAEEELLQQEEKELQE